MRKDHSMSRSTSARKGQGAVNGEEKERSRSWKLFRMLLERLGESCQQNRGLVNDPKVGRLRQAYLDYRGDESCLHGLIADLVELLGAQYDRRSMLQFAVQLFAGLVAAVASPLPPSWRLRHFLLHVFGVRYANAKEIHARFLDRALTYALDKNLGLRGFRMLIPVAHWASVILEQVDRKKYGGRPLPALPDFALTREGAEFLNDLFPVLERTPLFVGVAEKPQLIEANHVGVRWLTREGTPPVLVARAREAGEPAFARAIDSLRSRLADHRNGKWPDGVQLSPLGKLDLSVITAIRDDRLLRAAHDEARASREFRVGDRRGLLQYWDLSENSPEDVQQYVKNDTSHLGGGYFVRVPLYGEVVRLVFADLCVEYPRELETCRDKLWSFGGTEVRRILRGKVGDQQAR